MKPYIRKRLIICAGLAVLATTAALAATRPDERPAGWAYDYFALHYDQTPQKGDRITFTPVCMDSKTAAAVLRYADYDEADYTVGRQIDGPKVWRFIDNRHPHIITTRECAALINLDYKTHHAEDAKELHPVRVIRFMEALAKFEAEEAAEAGQ